MDFKKVWKIINRVPKKEQKAILAHVKAGKSITDICRITGLEILVVSGIIHDNIEHLSGLKRQVK